MSAACRAAVRALAVTVAAASALTFAGCGPGGAGTSAHGDGGHLASGDAIDTGPDDAGPDDATAGGDIGDGVGSPPDPGSDATLLQDTEAPAPLAAHAGPNLSAEIDADVTLDGSASTGAVSWAWDLGDGRQVDGEIVTVSYPAAGVFQAVLTVKSAAGSKRTDSAVITVVHPATHTPSQSSTIARLPGDTLRIVAVDPDADALDFLEAGPDGATFTATHHAATADRPRTVTPWGTEALVVPCQDAGVVQIHAADGGPLLAEIPLHPASRPYGAAVSGADVFITLQATGQLARIGPPGSRAGDPGPENPGAASLIEVFDVLPDARGVAALPDGRLAVTRWRSPDDAGQLAVLDPNTGAVELRALAVMDTPSSDTGSGGVPSWLDQVLVSPDGRQLALPSTQANFGEGQWLTGTPLTHETTVRAALSRWDLIADTEKQRVTFDNRGLASAGVFSGDGQWLHVAMRGTRAVVRLDATTGEESGALLDVGFAPAGLALSADDRWLFVDVPLAREIAIYDVSSWSPPPAAAWQRIARPGPLPYGPQILRGKQLFNDSADPRIARDGYIACAHCHLDGEADGRTWDFTDRGEGLRNTISLLGRAGAGQGPIHWSANFDEIQDFEHDIRGPFGGTGLLDDADWEAGTTNQTLGDPKAGKSEDLDALAAYAASLATPLPSPLRNPDGSLPAAATRGQELFNSGATHCTECHAGPHLTDSAFEAPATPLLHDVGTIKPGSGQRLGAGPLPGVDTPTLLGLWSSAPYLHDGSAATLRDVLVDQNATDQHGSTSQLSEAELDDLEAYLLCL